MGLPAYKVAQATFTERGTFILAKLKELGYRVGYRQGRADVLYPRQPTEDECNRALMKRTLPQWRRVAGWACIALGSLSFLPFTVLAARHGSGWAYVGAAVASIAALMAGAMVSEWCWKPYRDAQAQERKTQAQERKTPEDHDRHDL